jgi:hypothetical protein
MLRQQPKRNSSWLDVDENPIENRTRSTETTCRSHSWEDRCYLRKLARTSTGSAFLGKALPQVKTSSHLEQYLLLMSAEKIVPTEGNHNECQRRFCRIDSHESGEQSLT